MKLSSKLKSLSKSQLFKTAFDYSKVKKIIEEVCTNILDGQFNYFITINDQNKSISIKVEDHIAAMILKQSQLMITDQITQKMKGQIYEIKVKIGMINNHYEK